MGKACGKSLPISKYESKTSFISFWAISFAGKLALPMIKIRWDFCTLKPVNFVHLRWQRVYELGEHLRIGIPHFLSQTTHHTANMSWPWVSINTLWVNCPKTLDGPKIVPLRSKKQRILSLVSPKCWGVSAKMLFHEFLIDIRRVRLGEVLFLYYEFGQVKCR